VEVPVLFIAPSVPVVDPEEGMGAPSCSALVTGGLDPEEGSLWFETFPPEHASCRLATARAPAAMQEIAVRVRSVFMVVSPCGPVEIPRVAGGRVTTL
jgi:hypothetical protein